VVYRQPRVGTRVVYRQAPVVGQRVVYQPRARMVSRQPAYNTRVTIRQSQQPGRIVRANVRRDVVTTGSIRSRQEIRAQRRLMRQ
jgi:hypothetical protein